jgi:chaperonin cofactor prefoldin
MTELKPILQNALTGFHPAQDALERTLQKFNRRGRRQRMAAAAVASLVSLAATAFVFLAFGGVGERPASSEVRERLEARLVSLDERIGEFAKAQRATRARLSEVRALSAELESLLVGLESRIEEASSPEVRHQIAEQIKDTRTALAQREDEAAGLQEKLAELSERVAGLRGQQRAVREWLASLVDQSPPG